MQNMRKASHAAPSKTLSALKMFVSLRLLPEIQGGAQDDALLQAWLEKTTIAFILFATSASAEIPSSSPSEIQDLLDTIQAHNNVPFSAPATHAAQALIWKAIDAEDSTLSPVLHELLRHPLFDNAGHLNKGRIGRYGRMHFALIQEQR